MSNLLKSKILLGVMIVAVLVVGGIVVKTASATDCTLSAVTLKVGSTGADVICLQTKLAITADGNFGSLTKAAVVAYQTDNALTADGVVGANTRATLNTAVVADTTVYPAGCSAFTGFSTTTGLSCAAVSAFPAGCTSATGYSSTTGLSCAAVSAFPAGCTSLLGYSATTGLSCATVAATYSAGCTSATGFSTTTGLACTATTTTTGTLTGGAGSIDSYELIAGFSLEEVGEDEEDVKVAGIDIENSDGSDVTISAIKLVFDEGATNAANNDFDNYAAEVTIWLDSTKVATVDADEFTDNNNWTKTITLTGAVINSADTASLYIAVTGASTIDTNDITETWDVDVTSVRFIDGQGLTISEDPTVAITEFSFESFAASADTAIKIDEGVEATNDTRVIDVHATDDTDNVELLSFDMEIEGDSDVTIDDLPVTINTVEATGNDPDDLVTTLRLFADGVEIGTESLLTTDADDSTEVVLFDDMDYTIDAGDTVRFTVKAKVRSIADALDAGDTIQAVFGEVETSLATWDAEDETGTNVADADTTGTVTGALDEVRDIGINFTVGSKTATITLAADPATPASADTATYTINFTLEAFGGDVTIDGAGSGAGYCEEGGADAVDQGTEYIITTGGSNTTTCSFSSTADDNADDTGESWILREGVPKVFTLTSTGTATADHFAKTYLESINWDDLVTDTTPDLYFTAGLGETTTSTPELYLQVI